MNGKGDRNRSNSKAYAKGWDLINWVKKPTSSEGDNQLICNGKVEPFGEAIFRLAHRRNLITLALPVKILRGKP